MGGLGVGIIGCGVISGVHIDAIKAMDGAQIKMVCDSDEAKGRKTAEALGCSWQADYHHLLADATIQVVHILTPHYLHAPMAIDALKAGKHVVLEKPVGISERQLALLAKTAEAQEKVVGVTLQNRFNPTTLKMLALLEEKDYGRLLGAKGVLTWHRSEGYYRDSLWRGRRDLEGGGLLINQAIHTLDLMEVLGGKVKEISAMMTNFNHGGIEVEDTAVVHLTYDSGGAGQLMATNAYAKSTEIAMEFIYEQGTFRIEEGKLWLIEADSKEMVATDGFRDGEKSYWGLSHKYCIDNIYKAIMGTEPLKVTLSDAIRATTLVLASYESDRTKRPVKLA